MNLSVGELPSQFLLLGCRVPITLKYYLPLHLLVQFH
jgi:hypothetical protein